MVFWKHGPLSGLLRVPSGMFRKADIYGTILVSNFIFFKDKFANANLEVRITIWIVPGSLGDVRKRGHFYNNIPTGNVGVIFMFFKDKYVNYHFKYFESKDHYPNYTRYSRGCSIKRTFAEPCSYRYYWYQIDRTFKIQSLSVFGNTHFWKHFFPILATQKQFFLETTS